MKISVYVVGISVPYGDTCISYGVSLSHGLRAEVYVVEGTVTVASGVSL
jgi:hypothetical protein